jgi:pyridoxal phosphate enzyme (YggS family)
MAHVGFAEVQRRIEAACERAGVRRGDVQLVVVSKQRADAAVRAVYDEGHRVFGENREQGLRGRIASDLPEDISWHFIGPLQTRKVPFVGANVDLLQSLDRVSLGEKWAVRSTVPVLIEFNLASEPQKTGFAPEAAEEVIDTLLGIGLDVRGVMAIPPLDANPEASRPWFADLRRIFDRYREHHGGIEVCSMGMTNDFEIAIEEGATMVRVGRAIFG